MSKKKKGPQFLRFCIPIIDVLKGLDGSGSPSEVTDLVLEKLNIPEEEQEIVTKNGNSRVRNQVAWARFYLAKAGFLDSSKRGIWTLTEEGHKSNLDDEKLLKLFREVQAKFSKESKKTKKEPSDIEEETAAEEVDALADYRTELYNVLMGLPPSGFERLCKRLLRESGFEQVVVTGKSGDGGIDGHGILQVNPFVTFRVLFQCKRYKGTVSPSQVRDFRGAMMGRADKGIIITTGAFTLEAKREARRDGLPPIELVDGSKLLDMFEQLEFGLIPKKVFDVDTKFFEEFSEN